MSRRDTGLRPAAALLVVVLTVLLALGLVACGDKYAGTWKASVAGQDMTIKIEKSGDHYVVYDPATPDTKGEAKVQDGKLTATDAVSGLGAVSLERKDDTLVMSAGGMSITFVKQ